jgi:ketosteroid isomerase-like protein
MDSPNLRIVKELWDVLENQGVLASMEAMLEHAREDIELRPYLAGGQALRGTEEIREYIRQQRADGLVLRATPWNFEEDGDKVMVSGSLRVQRSDGSIADAQLRWTYTFREGRLTAAASRPLAT